MYAIVIHAHQKLDRISHRHLLNLLPKGTFFPSLKDVLHFEGSNGPDAVKLKKDTRVEQPWHFIDPSDEDDVHLQGSITHHYDGLVKALKAKDEVRSAFEAAWLAHALVDGLTPAHHYPYEQELAELRGEERHTRKGIIGRGFIKGDNLGQTIKHSLRLVGPKGLLTTHTAFEAGAYAIIMPLSLKRALPSDQDLQAVTNHGILGLFSQMVKEVDELKIYDRFIADGWTQRLSRDVRQELAPRMVRMVLLAWYAAAEEARA
ncbi:MAG: hypothetical protein JWO41_596 [Candidatus Saccharibacteria bacterium]|nr:hypothetical protein [Candidatus Saccharibacteria bacterium]